MTFILLNVNSSKITAFNKPFEKHTLLPENFIFSLFYYNNKKKKAATSSLFVLFLQYHRQKKINGSLKFSPKEVGNLSGSLNNCVHSH